MKRPILAGVLTLVLVAALGIAAIVLLVDERLPNADARIERMSQGVASLSLCAGLAAFFIVRARQKRRGG